MQPSDSDLIRAARGGDREAANLLVERYWAGAWRASFAISGRSELANDATQDAFERILKALGRIDEKRPFGAYLHRTVVNRTLDLLRIEDRQLPLEDRDELAIPAGELSEETEFLQAVQHLPEDRRVPIVLRYLFGYRPPEIAELLGLPEGTISSRMARGLSQLRQELEAQRGRL